LARELAEAIVGWQQFFIEYAGMDDQLANYWTMLGKIRAAGLLKP
jgi:hypothetical protein